MSTPLIHGVFDPEFVGLRDTFAENFAKRGEIGAAVCVYKDGRKVADLWGGAVDPKAGLEWGKDTIVNMMSVTKSMAALCLWRLIDRGVVDLDSPVAAYWPEFAQAGKEKITIRHILGGQGGLMYPDHAPVGSAFDWEVMTDAIARQEPEWPAGSKGAYHSVTQGFLLGEVVRRADGRMVNLFLKEEIMDPLGADFTIGLSDEQITRVAPIIPNAESVTAQQMLDPSTKLGRAWRVMPAFAERVNSEAYRKAVFPSGNGHGNARAIARVYGALANGGKLDGIHVLSADLIDELRKPAWEGTCDLTERQFRYGLGFFLSAYPDRKYGLHFSPNKRAFGHPGVGGALGLCDPEANFSFSYSPNHMCSGAGVGDRCEALVDATLECIGLI